MIALLAALVFSSVHVDITDAGTRKPLVFAQVSLYGPRSLQGETGADGSVTFDKLPPGTYEIVAWRFGYVEKVVHAISVPDNREADVAFALVHEPRRPPAWLRTIARLAAKPKQKSSPTRTSVESPEAKLSHSMVGALQTLPGVLLQSDGFAQYPSINGHAPTQTAVSIEGVPVGGFGSAANLQPFNLDLFSVVDVDERSAYGAPAGTIDFDAPDPALDWIGNGNSIEGGFGNAGLSLMERGTSGRLGVVVEHARRDQGNPLDGMRFLDTSGLNYVHDALAVTSGDIVKARYPFSLNNVLFASVTSIASNVPLFCTVFTGPVPCGYGPVNVQNNSLVSTQLRDALAVGRVSANVTLFHNRLGYGVDQSGRYIDGIPLPQSSNTTTLANGFVADGQVQVGRGYPVSFNITADKQITATDGNAFGTIVPPALSSLAYTSVSLSGPLFKQRFYSSDLQVGAQRQGLRAHVNGQLSFTFTPTSYDTYVLQYGTGFLSAPTAAFSGIADPPALQFNCQNGDAVGMGPWLPADNSSSTKTSLSWTHTARKLSLTTTVYHELDFNAPVNAVLSGNALTPALFTPAYLAGAERGYAAACGAAALLSPANLFYEVTAAAPRVAYDGGSVSLHLDASRNVAADFSYSSTLARAFGSSGPLFSDASTIISGEQLPQVPTHAANLSLAAMLDHAGVTALANARFIAANNPNNLPAYTAIDAGLQLPLHYGGRLTFSILNLTNTHAGTFATTHGAVALPTRIGAFPTIATPLLPRSINVAWSMPFGYGAQLSDVPNYDPGPSAYGFKLYPYPNAPPSDPFALDRRSGRCGPEAVPGGTKYLNAVRAYVQRIDAARTNNGAYPAAFPDDDANGLHLYYRRNGESFAILVAVDKNLSWDDRLTILKPLAGCARIYSGFLPETQRRHLYIPPYDEQQNLNPIFDFAPEVGFYRPPSLIENDALFPAYAPMPKAPPADSFALAPDARCPSNVRSAAQAFIALVEPYIAAYYGGKPVPPPDGFTITAHHASRTTWLEIQSDTISVKLLAQCLTIAGAQREALYKLGLDGSRAPSIDYAPQIGFYDVW